MITGRDFVVLSDDWDGLPTSAIHLFRRLKNYNRVFWFNTIGRMPRPTLRDAGKVVRAVCSWTFGRFRRISLPVNDSDTLQVVSPLMVPWFKPLVRRCNRAAMLRRYESLCRKYEIRDPIVITTFPPSADFVQAVPAALKVYYCVDDFLDYPGLNHRDWAVMEEKLLRAVDALVVTSKKLTEKRLTQCPVLHLPHGVDFDHFHDAVVRAEPEPHLEHIRKPIVGFFGLISQWVDLENIAWLADVFPECSFVLIGQKDVSLSPIKGRSNVHYLGQVPYAELPRYARYFDVGLISFVQSRLTQAINPLKLLEYFALGLPVLATRLPELELIAGPLWLADSREDFRRGLEDILRDQLASRGQDAITVARNNTWDARVEELSGFLEGMSPMLDQETVAKEGLCQPLPS